MSGLFGSKKSASQTSKAVSALQVQTSTSGQVLPLLWGANLIAGNLAWYGNWVATPHTSSSSSGGKGGGVGGSSTTSYTYTTGVIISLCEGQIAGIGIVWNDQAQSTAGALGFTVFNGATPQSTWSFLSSFAPTQAIPYNGTAYVAASALNLGSDTSMPNYNFEVLGPLAFSAGTINDALPSDIITDYLTNATHGAGFAGHLGSTTNLRNYCLARSLFMSPIEDQQRTASSFMDDMATWCNFACVWSYKQLQLIPYGDTAISSIYGSFTPNVTPIYALGADDFTFTGNGTNGVELDWEDIEDCYNSVAIEYNDRSQGYNTSVQNATDQADIDARGPYPMSDVQVNGITTAAVARDVAQLMLQRSLYIRKTYSFTTSLKYMLLEPMDPVTLTDPNAGLFNELVRITKVTEQDDSIDFEAEELPIGIAHAPIYTTQSPFGYSQDYNVSPGNVSQPVIFNAPGLLTKTGYETWIAVAGIGAFWGGCEVYMSADNLTYKAVGIISAPARYGALTAALPAGNDPDTTNTLKVALLTGQLTSGSAGDADNWRQFAFVGSATNGGEFIAFETATLTGTEAYTLSYLRRGGYGSTSQAHIATDVFVRIDDGVFRVPYDRGMIGQTVYFKFVSFNSFGGGEQTLAGVTAYPHVIGASDVVAPPMLFDQLAGQFATPSSGTNFVPNPSFELNNIGALTGVTVIGAPVCDSWYLYGNDSAAFNVGRDSSSTDVGSNDLSIFVKTGFSLPASAAVTCRVVSAPIYVAAGQLLSYSGDIRTDSSGGNGSTVTWRQVVGMLFFNAVGAIVSGGDSNVGVSCAANAPTGAYTNYPTNQFTVPAGASYAVAYVFLSATNSSSTTAVTLNSWAARFDNMQGLFVTSAGQINYTGGVPVQSLQPAQAGADVTASQALVSVINPNFANALTGWTPNGANQGWYAETGTHSANPNVNTYAVHAGSTVNPPNSTGTLTSALRNNAFAPVTPGEVFSVAAQILNTGGANGSALARISWRDASQNEISVTEGNYLTSGTGTSRISGPAPVNAVYAHAECAVYGHTVGYWTWTAVSWSYQPTSVDEVPDGTSRFGAIYNPATQTGVYVPGANMVKNALFALGLSYWTVGSGWSSFILNGQPCAFISLTATATTSVLSSNAMAVGAAVAVSASVELLLNSTFTAGDASADVEFFNSSGGAISTSARIVVISTPNGGFTKYTLNNIMTPTGTASCIVRVYIESATASAGQVLVRRVKLELGTVATPFNDDATQVGNNLTAVGSGQQIGDQRNLLQRTVTNIPAKVPSVISYSAAAGTPAVATISVAAFTTLAGSVSVSYSGMSVSTSGTNGTSPTYYLYFNDPTYAGGAQTLVATTNGNDLYANNGTVYVGPIVVAYPTSGGGSGGGGGGGGGACVCDHMFVYGDRTSGESVTGDLFDCLDLPTSGLAKFKRRLLAAEHEVVECVRLTTIRGAVLDCSKTTPFDLIDGGATYAPHMLGEMVVTDLGIEEVVTVEDIGLHRVSFNHFGGISYAAGADPAHRIYSHNVGLKP